MKKVIYTLSCIFVIALLASCHKNVDHESKQIVIDTTITSGTEFLLDLKPYGDQDDVAAITKQATAFSTSEIVNTPGTFAPVYHYIANTKSTVTDQVVLAITEGTRVNGSRTHHSDSTTITINFLVK